MPRRPQARRATPRSPAPARVRVLPETDSPKADAERAAAWARLTAGDLVRREVISVARDCPLSELSRILADQRISGAPVVDETGTIVGVVSMRDLLDRYAEDDASRPRKPAEFYQDFDRALEDEDLESLEPPEQTEDTVADVMTGEVFSVPLRATLREVAAAMSRHRIHRVLVEDGGRYVGVLSTLEILDALAR